MDPSQLTPEQLATTPLEPPPPGVQSNFVNPESNAPGYTVGIVIVTALMIALVAGRVYSKIRLVKKSGPDDVAAIIGCILTTVTAIQLIVIFWGPGWAKHTWDVPLSAVIDPSYYNSLFAIQIVSPLCSFCAKLSILLFLLIIFPYKARRATTLALWLGIVLNCLCYGIITIYSGAVCGPRGNPGIRDQVACPDIAVIRIGQALASINIFLDVYTLLVAIPSIWRLQMSTRRKFGVIAVFLTGFIAIALSCVTLYYRVEIDKFPDPAWSNVTPLAFGFFEPAIGIIVACLPTLPPLWHQVAAQVNVSWKRLLTNFNGRSQSNQTAVTYPSQNLSMRSPDRERNSSNAAAQHSITPFQHEHELHSLSPPTQGSVVEHQHRNPTGRERYESL